MIWASVSSLALYVGLLNSVPARYAGTCTQGDASHLLGIVWSIPFFLLALTGLWRTIHLRATILVSLPAFVVLAWQSHFAARLLIYTVVYGYSACQVLEGIYYEPDGFDTALAALWSSVMFTTLVAILAIFIRRLWKKSGT